MSESTQDPSQGGSGLEGPADGGAEGIPGVQDGGADGSADAGLGVSGDGGGGAMVAPTAEQMVEPTAEPTAEQMVEPTAEQMEAPTAARTEALRVQQTVVPRAPLASKTEEPMGAPMAEQTEGPTAEPMAAPLAEDSVLPRLIAVDRDLFADQYWGQQPLLSPAADLPAGFTELLDADAIDELVSQRGLRTPFLRVAKNGTTLADKAFTAPGGVGAGIADQVSDDRLVRLFADGSTLVLQALHRVWPPILEFCQQLAAELGHPVQANAYVTPPQNQGFSAHYDVHDVFVLQIEGEKRWRIHPPVLESPLRDQPWNDRKAAVEKRAARASADRGLAPAWRLSLPAARIPSRRYGPRRCQHPPHSRGSCLDPLRTRGARHGPGAAKAS